MKLLIWMPIYIKGGGLRLFISLVNAISENSQIEKCELIIKKKLYNDIKNKINTSKIDVTITDLTNQGRFIDWLKKDANIFYIPKTRRLKRVIKKFISKLLKIQIYENEKQKIAYIFRTSNCDLVYCFWPHFNEFIETNKPVVCTIHDTILFEFPELIRGYYTNLERKRQIEWIQKTQKIIVSSQNTKKNIERFFGYYEHIEVIRYDAIPLSDENNEKNDKTIPFSLPTKYIIYPANISPHKNHYNLFIAYQRILKNYAIPLVLVGIRTDTLGFEGDEYPVEYDWNQLRLLGLIRRLGLKKYRDFFPLGYVDDEFVLHLIRNAYALIMPSLSEGGGSYPVEEALSLGTPVLCSDIPVMREHLQNRKAKIAWFDPLSVDSMVNAIKDLLDNYDEYKKTTIAATQDKRPTWQLIADKYIKVFEKVIEGDYKRYEKYDK